MVGNKPQPCAENTKRCEFTKAIRQQRSEHANGNHRSHSYVFSITRAAKSTVIYNLRDLSRRYSGDEIGKDSSRLHLIIRVPVVPTFNDTPAEIAAIARFADSLPNVTEMHLLPYHRLGQDKYAGLGRTYLMDGIVPPTNEHMNMLLTAAQSASTKLHVQIGG